MGAITSDSFVTPNVFNGIPVTSWIAIATLHCIRSFSWLHFSALLAVACWLNMSAHTASTITGSNKTSVVRSISTPPYQVNAPAEEGRAELVRPDSRGDRSRPLFRPKFVWINGRIHRGILLRFWRDLAEQASPQRRVVLLRGLSLANLSCPVHLKFFRL